MIRLGIGRKAWDIAERTLGVSALGALVVISNGVASRDFTTMEGDEVGGLLVFLFGIAC